MPKKKKKRFRLIVAGSRNVRDPATTYDAIEELLEQKGIKKKRLVIVSGGAAGPDSHAVKWAKAKGVRFRLVLASWDLHGKSAGIIRNVEMAKMSDGLLALWDGESRGTAHMIVTAKNRKLKVKVVHV